MIIRKHYIFHGDVQGVGFRYRARYAANLYGITGWVRNLYDGTVEMEAEGEYSAIENLLTAINDGRFINIDHFEEKTVPLYGSTSFQYY